MHARRSDERGTAAVIALAECERLAIARASPRALEVSLCILEETRARHGVRLDEQMDRQWRGAASELIHSFPTSRGSGSAVGLLWLNALQAAAPHARTATERIRLLAVRSVDRWPCHCACASQSLLLIYCCLVLYVITEIFAAPFAYTLVCFCTQGCRHASCAHHDAGSTCMNTLYSLC